MAWWKTYIETWIVLMLIRIHPLLRLYAVCSFHYSKYNCSLLIRNGQYWYLPTAWGGCCCHKLSNFYFISFPQNSLFEKATGTGHKNIAYHIYQSLTVIVFSTIGPLAPKYYSYFPYFKDSELNNIMFDHIDLKWSNPLAFDVTPRVDIFIFVTPGKSGRWAQ